MCGPEKTQTSDNKQQTDQTQPRTGRPPGWMDGGRIPPGLRPACRPVPSHLVSPRRREHHRHPQHTTHIALSAARSLTGSKHGRLPRPRRPASPLSPPPPPPPPPLRLHHQALAEPNCAASAHLLSDQIDRLPEGLGPGAEERCIHSTWTPLADRLADSAVLPSIST
jgi:hypothetical protein